MNCIFLEEAIGTHAIVYKSKPGLQRAIEAYLREDQRGLKICHSNTDRDGSSMILQSSTRGLCLTATADLPEYRREAYLLAMEEMAFQLGGNVEAKYTVTAPQVIDLLPPLPYEFCQLWQKLGKPLEYHECIGQRTHRLVRSIGQCRSVFNQRFSASLEDHNAQDAN